MMRQALVCARDISVQNINVILFLKRNVKDNMNQPVLRTDRLTLRPLEPDDDSRIYTLANHRSISQMTAQIPYPYPRELATEWINTHPGIWEQGKGMVYGIIPENDSELAGVVSLQNVNTVAPLLGYWLGVDFWGNGYATEAGKTLCRFAGESFGINRIFASHLEKNPASGRVLKKIGFEFIGMEERYIAIHKKNAIVCSYLLHVEYMGSD